MYVCVWCIYFVGVKSQQVREEEVFMQGNGRSIEAEKQITGTII